MPCWAGSSSPSSSRSNRTARRGSSCLLTCASICRRQLAKGPVSRRRGGPPGGRGPRCRLPADAGARVHGRAHRPDGTFKVTSIGTPGSMRDMALFLLESVLPERSSSDIGLLIDLEMLAAVGGGERTHAEWVNLLGRSRFLLKPCRPHGHAGVDHRSGARLITDASHATPERLSALRGHIHLWRKSTP